MNLCDRSNCFTQGFLSLSHYQQCNTKQTKIVPGNIPNCSGLLGPTITEMGIHFTLKMLSRFSEPVFVFSLLK